jgi:predicted RNase H-like HicB family nuclease
MTLEMYKYELIIFWREEVGRYVVEHSEPSGCIADGLGQKSRPFPDLT